MFKYNKAIGDYGEYLSINYLMKKGHRIICRNFRCKLGEIDIISKIDDINCICFTEVKSRYNYSYGIPSEAVNYRKISRIKNAAKYYIKINNIMDVNFRFDVIEIFFNKSNNDYSLNLIENAF